MAFWRAYEVGTLPALDGSLIDTSGAGGIDDDNECPAAHGSGSEDLEVSDFLADVMELARALAPGLLGVSSQPMDDEDLREWDEHLANYDLPCPPRILLEAIIEIDSQRLAVASHSSGSSGG